MIPYLHIGSAGDGQSAGNGNRHRDHQRSHHKKPHCGADDSGHPLLPGVLLFLQPSGFHPAVISCLNLLLCTCFRRCLFAHFEKFLLLFLHTSVILLHFFIKRKNFPEKLSGNYFTEDTSAKQFPALFISD